MWKIVAESEDAPKLLVDIFNTEEEAEDHLEYIKGYYTAWCRQFYCLYTEKV